MSVVYVAVGGALGAVARYGLTGWVQAQATGGFPWGTMVVNVMGSFLLGASVAWLATSAVTPETREFVTIGLLGAFTTFSTFTYETVALVRESDRCRSGRFEGKPLYEAILLTLRERGFAGATVVRALAGFGASARLHTGNVLRLSSDLPVIVEVVEREEKIQEVLPELDEMIGGGLITLERARVIMYRPEEEGRPDEETEASDDDASEDEEGDGR